MFFKSVTIAGFGSFPEVPTTFTFDNKFTTIVGKNGSGKTSVLHAIMWVLFGKESSRVAGDMGSVVNKACYQADVTLELVDNEGDEVTIRRVYADTDRGGNHTLTVKRGRFKKTSITAAQKEIWRILDVDPSVFLALSVIDQHGTGKIDSIMKASPAERRAVISALLPNGEEWAKVHKRAVAARREAKRTLKEKESELRHVETEFAALPHLGDTLDCPFSDEDLRAARAKAQKLELEDNDKKRHLHEQLEKLREEEATATAELGQKAQELQAQLVDVQQQWANYNSYAQQLESARSNLDALTQKTQGLPTDEELYQAQFLTSDIHRLSHLTNDECPMCRAGLTQEEALPYIQYAQAQLQRINGLGLSVDAIVQIKAECRAAQTYYDQLAGKPVEQPQCTPESIVQRIGAINEEAASLPVAQRIVEVTNKIAKVNNEELIKARREVDNIAEIMAQHSRDLHERERAAIMRNRIETLEEEYTRLDARVQALEVLVQASDPGGITSVKIDAEAKRLCDAANDVLLKIGADSLLIRPETRETTRGSKITPELFFVHGEGALTRDVKTFSSGEQARVSCAMALGAALQTAESLSVLLLDEPMSMVDDETATLFNKVLEESVSAGDIDQVIMTSRLAGAVNPMEVPSAWKGVS